MTAAQWDYDFFVSHATEDKESFVHPLAVQMRRLGLNVWYDTFSLGWGDSILESIELGLTRSRFGIVVLSHAFFGKRWPRQELDALFTLESADNRKRILPVWHGVGQEDVATAAPMVAGKYALNSQIGVEALADEAHQFLLLNGVPSENAYKVINDSTVDIVELARLGNGVVEGYWFKECTLLGPAVIMPLDVAAFVECGFHPAALWTLNARDYIGVIAVRRCRFERVDFGGVGVVASAEMLQALAQSSARPGPTT